MPISIPSVTAVILSFIDDTRSVESLISAECQKLNFPVLRKQLFHLWFASGFQCMTLMTVNAKEFLILVVLTCCSHSDKHS